MGSRTFAKYLHTVSAALPRSWLNGHALPAWQAPCRKNLQGTCEVSSSRNRNIFVSTKVAGCCDTGAAGTPKRCVDGRSGGQENSGWEQRLTWWAAWPFKPRGGHRTHRTARAAGLRWNVEAAAAHMTMLAWVGGCHGCGSEGRVGWEFFWVAGSANQRWIWASR